MIISPTSTLFPGTIPLFCGSHQEPHNSWGTPTRPKGLVQSHLHGKSLKMGDPKVTIGFNTESWSSVTWMIWAYPYDFGTPKWAFFKILLAFHYTGCLRTGFSVLGLLYISTCNSPIYWLVQYPNKSPTNNRIEMFWTLLKEFQFLDSIIIHSVDIFIGVEIHKPSNMCHSRYLSPIL